jgi:hypothetical protein
MAQRAHRSEYKGVHLEIIQEKLMKLKVLVWYAVAVNKSTTFVLGYMVAVHEFRGNGFSLISLA